MARHRVDWRRVSDSGPEVGLVFGEGGGMADALAALRRGHTRLDWAVSHAGGWGKHFAWMASGWMEGSLICDGRVAEGVDIRTCWPHDLEVRPSHMRYLVLTGGPSGAVTWLGTASLVSYRGTPDWWLVGEGDWLRDRVSAPVSGEGVWVAEHEGVTIRGLRPWPPRYWYGYYAHPRMTRWAVDRGCRVAICSNQGRRNPQQARRHPACVRQWGGSRQALGVRRRGGSDFAERLVAAREG